MQVSIIRVVSLCFLVCASIACSHLYANDLVDLKKVNPKIFVEMRYATNNNPLGLKIYPTDKCYVVAEVADRLSKAQRALEKEGYALKVLDAYRPYRLMRKQSPKIEESDEDCFGHCRGTSVDVALVCVDGSSLDMGGDFGFYSSQTSRSCKSLSAHVYHNRQKLERVMKRYGFISSPGEWWHFDYASCSLYPVLDIPFEEL